jgi:uncharacterized membrane protein
MSGKRTAVVSLAVVWLFIAAYAAFFGVLTVQKHLAFQTTAFDLGNVDQAVWNTRHGRLLAMTNIEGLDNRFGTHVEPILLPISLLYFLWSDPRLLLILQTLVIAIGAWPVYLIARHELGKHESEKFKTGWQAEALAVTFAAVYLLFPALQSANVFDFHTVALVPTFFLFAFYCLETERWGGYAVFAALTMSCKEDMPLLIAMLGLYTLVVRRRWLVGVITMAVAALWFLLAVGWIMPHFDTGGVSPFANRYAYLGDGPLAMAITLITHPGVAWDQLRAAGGLAYVRDLLAPVAFLALLAPQVLVLLLPVLAVNLLSTDGFMHQLEGFHYGAPLVPVVVVAGVYAAAWLVRRFPRFRALPGILSVMMLAATFQYHYGHGYTPLAASSYSWPVVTGHDRLGQEIARSPDPKASLAALPYLNPHASQRQQLSMIDHVENGLPAPLHGAEYVWLDVTNGWPLHPNDLKTGVENLLAGDYGVDQADDGWLLLRRGAPDKTLPASFYDFARISQVQPEYALQLQFLLDGEPALECLGFDLDQTQPTATSLTFYWRALKPLPAGLRLYPFYFDDSTGQILEDTSLRPMISSVWYPPEQWQVGEIVQTSTLPWDVGSSWSAGLGVVQGDDWGSVERRLSIRVGSSDLTVRLFDGDSWARLLQVQDGKPVAERRVFAAPAAQFPVGADLGGQVRLVSYNLERIADTEVRVTLFWQAQRRLDTSFTVFAQLIGPEGAIRAQADSVPQGGGYPTIWWMPGEVVADPITLSLPPGAPRGVTYRLIVGLYDPRTGARLPLVGSGVDFVELTAVAW